MLRALALILVLALGATAASAQAPRQKPQDAPEQSSPPPTPAEPPPPIYDSQLQRLSEILGALHFLRALCGAGDSAQWQEEMQALLDAEKPTPMRRAQLVARFNYGFETYNAVYRVCTPSAQRAIALYLTEGERLSDEIRRRFGQ
ncbi:TIGR02301 family protein [Faunimonas sp. B44]|uniref:TIGR02301 family protein n=1 Tax=Faunimonas sp. B44 TaxID=3461493 RepID=UPI0040449380